MIVTSGKQRLYDGLAIGASLLCLIHCLALPVLIVLLPTLAAFLTMPETVHVWAILFATPTSALALLAGYRRHGWTRPTRIVLPGLVLMAAGAFVPGEEWVETVLTVPGALLLAIGHALNWRALRGWGRDRERPEKGMPS